MNYAATIEKLCATARDAENRAEDTLANTAAELSAAREETKATWIEIERLGDASRETTIAHAATIDELCATARDAENRALVTLLDTREELAAAKKETTLAWTELDEHRKAALEAQVSNDATIAMLRSLVHDAENRANTALADNTIEVADVRKELVAARSVNTNITVELEAALSENRKLCEAAKEVELAHSATAEELQSIVSKAEEKAEATLIDTEEQLRNMFSQVTAAQNDIATAHFENEEIAKKVADAHASEIQKLRAMASHAEDLSKVALSEAEGRLLDAQKEVAAENRDATAAQAEAVEAAQELDETKIELATALAKNKELRGAARVAQTTHATVVKMLDEALVREKASREISERCTKMITEKTEEDQKLRDAFAKIMAVCAEVDETSCEDKIKLIKSSR